MPKKILVVDDELDILKIVAVRLKSAGYDIVTAADGEEGLDLARKEKPDLIFLDLRLPFMNGYEVCEAIKKDNELKSIPVVFLTASNAATVAKKAKEFKADDYLIKPFEAEELFAKVKKFLG